MGSPSRWILITLWGLGFLSLVNISQAQLSSPVSNASLETLLKPAPAHDVLLDPAEAFIASATLISPEQLQVHWTITDGYYLYRQRFQFSVDIPAVVMGQPQFPTGLWIEDEFFGEVETYRHEVVVQIPLVWSEEHDRPSSLELHVHSQGCADIGVCFPPRQEVIPVILSNR